MLECKVHVYGIRLEQVPEFKYLGCVLDESGADGSECSRKVASGSCMAGAIRLIVNAMDLQLECAKGLHETLLVPVLTYGREKCYGRRRRYLGLGLYIWTTSEACLVLGGWIEFRVVRSDEGAR